MTSRCTSFINGVASGVYGCADYAGDVVVGVGELPDRVGNLFRQSTRTISGLFFTSLSVLTLGKVSKFNSSACGKMDSVDQILPTVYLGVLSIINHSKTKVLIPSSYGYFRREVTLFDKARDLSGVNYSGKKSLAESSDDEGDDIPLTKLTLRDRVKLFMKEQVASRGMYALAAVVAVISRVADLIIGVLAVAASIICLGKKEKINKMAVDNLTIFGVLDDICNGVRAFVNPMQNDLTGYRFKRLPSIFRKTKTQEDV
jgi:hypothetical protein